MLLRFEVENFLSIRDRQEILLTASRHIKRQGPTLPVPVLREEAVPVAVVYGANASGKTNLVEAIRHMRGHVVQSHKARDATDEIPRPHFRLDKVSAAKPTRFACTFAVQNADSNGGAVYDYGFEFSDTEYGHESLYRTVLQRRQTTQLMFDRTTADGETQVRFGGRLAGENKAIAALTRPNSLFLSAAAQNNHPLLSSVHRQFVERCVLAKADNEQSLGEALEDYEHSSALVQLLRQADVGVTDIDVEVVELDLGRGEEDQPSRAISDMMASTRSSTALRAAAHSD